MRWARAVLWMGLAWSLPRVAAAQPAPAAGEGFALVVGSNLGGPGQDSLRYAEQDAERVAEVLTSLGGYEPERVVRLVQPTSAELRAALDEAKARVEPLARSGVQARFFFYYSGHARADALNLGDEQLPLSELRERITALPATLSIVVLDGCQSGAFSRVKGADKAADFSWNSIERLSAQGIAVVASSSALELSQESDELGSGYFTHHWLVALRGGADRDADGRVTLSEAYQYAYNHTLATTARTAVGEQHATLETNIHGNDDVLLTQPAQANTRLRIPAAYAGRVLVQRLPSWAVFAELDKAPGHDVVLALPAGDYAATLRRGEQTARCTLELSEGRELALDPSACPRVSSRSGEVKGGAAAANAATSEVDGSGDEAWLIDLALGFGTGHEGTEYVQRLTDFGFVAEGNPAEGPRFMLAVGRRLHPHLAAGLSYFNLQGDDYARAVDLSQEQSFGWNAHALGAFAQGDVGLARRAVNLFARLGAGVSFAWTELEAVVPEQPLADRDPAFQDTTLRTQTVSQTYVRPCGWLATGLHLSPWRHFGFLIEGRYVYAPALDNELGDTYDLGGLSLLVGLHIRTWE